MADIIARPLMVIFERSWQSEEVLEDQKKAKCHLSLQKGQEGVPRQLLPHLNFWKLRLVLEAIFKYVEDQKGTERSQHGFAKGKSCSTNPIVF